MRPGAWVVICAGPHPICQGGGAAPSWIRSLSLAHGVAEQGLRAEGGWRPQVGLGICPLPHCSGPFKYLAHLLCEQL